MVELYYMLIDIKKWAQISHVNGEHPNIAHLLRSEAVKLFLELRRSVLKDHFMFSELSMSIAQFVIENPYPNPYHTLVDDGVLHPKVLGTSNILGYFENLAYHILFKTEIVNALSDNEIFVSHGGNDSQMQSLIVPAPYEERLLSHQRFIRAMMRQHGVEVDDLDLTQVQALPHIVEDPYGISLITCLPDPLNWQRNLELRRINKPDEDLPLTERVRLLRQEYKRFYTMLPLTHHQMREAGFTQAEMINYNGI